jgi:hypothetical protein
LNIHFDQVNAFAAFEVIVKATISMKWRGVNRRVALIRSMVDVWLVRNIKLALAAPLSNGSMGESDI